MNSMPGDIYPESRNRLPLVARETLDEERKKIYDHHTASGIDSSLAGLQGPGGLQLYSPAGPHLTAVNRYLRFGSGIDGKLREVAILTTAREHSHQFEWTMHEPMALKEGIEQRVIEIIKYRKPVDGIPEEYGLIIRFGRALFGERKVPSDLFAQARAKFGDRQLVDLVLLMGNYTATGVLLTAFDMQLPPDRPGMLPE
jgi:4-carboxymuconolactone decarboxylase